MEFTNELFRKTEDCLALFHNTLGPEKLTDDDWFEDRAVAFLWWSHGLKAQKTGRSSLDYRLKDRPDIQKVVAGLLDTLAISLKKYLHTDQESIRGERDDNSSESEKSSSGSAWSEFSDVTNGSEGKDDAADDTKTIDSDPRFYIETSLKMLGRISIAIKRSGTKLRYLKADEHLLTHSNDDEYIQLRRYLLFLILVGPYERNLFAELERRVINKQISMAVEIVVRSWIVDPSRATTVQQRLIEANIIRRNRITYARRFISKRASKIQNQETDVPTFTPSGPPTTFLTARESSTDSSNIQDVVAMPVPAQLEYGGHKPAQTITAKTLTATELGSQFVLPITTPLEHKKGAVSIATRMTQTGTKQDYPACPINKGSFECPYCVQVLTEDYTTKSRWRGHVAQDLNPYSCIYQACPDSLNLFATKEEWVKHTSAQHSSEHWVCDDCIIQSDQTEEFVFESQDLWESHMRSHHSCPDNRLILLRNVSKRTLTRTVGCPLCKRADKVSMPDEDDHIAEHLHAWALKALPWDLNPDDETSSDSPDLGSGNDLAVLSDMSDRSKDAGDRGEATVVDEIDRAVHCLKDKPLESSPQLAKLTYILNESIQKWNARTRLDAQNEIMLRHLTSINQTRAQLNHILQTESEDDQFTTQQQQEIDASLCTHIEIGIDYVNEVLILGETKVEANFNNSQFPRVKGHNIPPAYRETEGILRKAWHDLTDSSSTASRIDWASDVLNWATTTDNLRAKGLISQVASDSELTAEAINIITFWAARLNSEALYCEGKWFESGQFGRKKDLEEAKSRYIQSAEGGSPRAEYRLARILEQAGRLDEALGHYENAERADDSAASRHLALKELHSKNIRKAIALLRKSAHTADKDAPQGAYLYGLAIARRLNRLAIDESLLPLDNRRAFSYVEDSACLGYAKAQLLMGRFYEHGELDCHKDLAKAFHYYHLAATQGSVGAIASMSEWLYYGLDGVVLPNMEWSFKFASWGAAEGHPLADFMLGVHYHKGIHVERDLREAERWYEQATLQSGFYLATRPDYETNFEKMNRAARKEIESIAKDRLAGDNRLSLPWPRPEGKTIIVGIDLGALFSSVSWADLSHPHKIHHILDWRHPDRDLVPEGHFPTRYTRMAVLKELALQPPRLRASANAWQDGGLSVLDDLCSGRVELRTKAARFLMNHLEALWRQMIDLIVLETTHPILEFILSLSVPDSLSSEATTTLRNVAWDAMALTNPMAIVQINVVGQKEATIMSALKAQYQQRGLARLSRITIKDGDIVILCDCGATGARAVSYGVMTMTPPLVQTRTSCDSKQYGNQSVDMLFITYLFKHRSSSLGSSKSALSELEVFVKNDWEYGLKRSFTGSEKVTLQLPRRAMSSLGRFRSTSQKLTLEPDTICDLFKETLSSIKGVISSQLEALGRLEQVPNSIILVGGMAQSPYIVRYLQDTFDIPFQISKSTATISRGLVKFDVQRLLHQRHPVLAELEG